MYFTSYYFSINVLTKMTLHSVWTLDRPRVEQFRSFATKYRRAKTRIRTLALDDWPSKYDEPQPRSPVFRIDTRSFESSLSIAVARASGKKMKRKNADSGARFAFRMARPNCGSSSSSRLCGGLCRRWQNARSGFCGITRYRSSPRKPTAVSYSR
jgi:hypothetical protein